MILHLKCQLIPRSGIIRQPPIFSTAQYQRGRAGGIRTHDSPKEVHPCPEFVDLERLAQQQTSVDIRDLNAFPTSWSNKFTERLFVYKVHAASRGSHIPKRLFD
jgi:hypothetical protein